ncbi:MAG: exodeoxyribonuclease III [Actinomycetota bacterium]
MTKARALTVASINVNGLRAALTNGMGGWLTDRRPDVVTMQEVRAPDELVAPLMEQVGGSGWQVAHHQAIAKGRAGVAVATRSDIAASRTGLIDPCGEPCRFDASGRWVEADIITPEGHLLTIVSCYVHTGDADDLGRMTEKLAFLDAMTHRMQTLRADGRHVLLTGDLNVGHRESDIKNWKGNRGKAGFLPEERARFDRWFDELGWVDVGRTFAGDVAGPYTWWSWRGKAFDIDSGWRIDYHIASPELAATATMAAVDRAPTYAERWSDHAPVVVTYRC